MWISSFSCHWMLASVIVDTICQTWSWYYPQSITGTCFLLWSLLCGQHSLPFPVPLPCILQSIGSFHILGSSTVLCKNLCNFLSPYLGEGLILELSFQFYLLRSFSTLNKPRIFFVWIFSQPTVFPEISLWASLWSKKEKTNSYFKLNSSLPLAISGSINRDQWTCWMTIIKNIW